MKFFSIQKFFSNICQIISAPCKNSTYFSPKKIYILKKNLMHRFTAYLYLHLSTTISHILILKQKILENFSQIIFCQIHQLCTIYVNAYCGIPLFLDLKLFYIIQFAIIHLNLLHNDSFKKLALCVMQQINLKEN